MDAVSRRAGPTSPARARGFSRSRRRPCRPQSPRAWVTEPFAGWFDGNAVDWNDRARAHKYQKRRGDPASGCVLYEIID